MNHEEKILVADFGNSKAKFAVFSDGLINESTLYAIKTYLCKDAQDLKEAYKEFFQDYPNENYGEWQDVRKCVYASVNKNSSKAFLKLIKKHFPLIELIEVDNSFDFSFKSNVDDFSEVGIDLLCNCEETIWYLSVNNDPHPVFICDAGTLTKVIFLNYNIDSKEYTLEGVNITIGVSSALEGMKKQTAFIPKNFKFFKDNVHAEGIGKNTPDSLRIGAETIRKIPFYLMSDTILAFVSPEFDDEGNLEFPDIEIILCGGDAPLVLESIDNLPIKKSLQLSLQPTSTLNGIFRVYDNTLNKKIQKDA